MASSRKPRPRLDPLEQSLLDAVTKAAQALPSSSSGRAPLILAYSGGADSTALLGCAARLRAAGDAAFQQLLAVHVHHGLQPQADAWAQQCEAFCAERGIPFVVRRVLVARSTQGLEAAARQARYAALSELALEHKSRCVLTAHHLDDRIETFLINWLRGAGVDGLASYPVLRPLHEDGVWIARPWFDVPRSALCAYVEQHGLPHVEDPSNRNPRMLRNALRLGVLPALEAARPGFRRAAARSIDILADAAAVLGELAVADLAHCAEGAPEGMLRLDRLDALSSARAALVLRAWLAQAGVDAPSRARLRDALHQARSARSDAKLLLRFATTRGASLELRRHRGLLLLRRLAADKPLPRGTIQLCWRGEEVLSVPQWGGRLHIEPTQGPGFDAQWLVAQALQLRQRTGGERFKPYATRPSRTLKRLFQDAEVREYERAALPLIWRNDELIFVAGLGADVRHLRDNGDRVVLRWEPDPLLIHEDHLA